jgi:DNA modification methylase
MQVLCGDCLTVLKGLEKESVDTIYTCPSPFRYYEDEQTGLIGSEIRLNDYINNIQNILMECHRVLKPTGSFFLQTPEYFNKLGGMFGMTTVIENMIKNLGLYFFMNRLFWHRTETRKLTKYKERGFLKNYEYIFHLVKDGIEFYFNEKSKYAKTSVFSYPLEDTYYTNEFDSGLPYQLSEMVIDTTCPPKGTVLDPLCGSAKVGVVAKKMGRDFIGIDINLETVETARIRLGI